MGQGYLWTNRAFVKSTVHTPFSCSFSEVVAATTVEVPGSEARKGMYVLFGTDKRDEGNVGFENTSEVCRLRVSILLPPSGSRCCSCCDDELLLLFPEAENVRSS